MINVNELTDYGFTQFNIKDVDENLYNELSELIGDGAEKYQEELCIVRTSYIEPIEMESEI